MDSNRKIIDIIKKVIDKNGLDYLTRQPFDVYQEIVDNDIKFKLIASGIFMLIVTGVWDSAKLINDKEERLKTIQHGCCLNKKLSIKLADIIGSVYSLENLNTWREQQGCGLKQFLKQEHTFNWNGSEVWDDGNGIINCFYEAEIVLQPNSKSGENAEIQSLLNKNPFLSADEIHKFYSKNISLYLDDEFSDYCLCDGYYEPVVEDFEIEYYVEEWCAKNGFTLISCEGDGDDSGYIPI